MTSVRNSARELMLWLSAADQVVLEDCPREATRFVAAGGAVAFTTAMAFASGSYAAYALIHMGVPLSLLFGGGWSLGIMNLERYVQSSIRRQRTPWLTWLQALPRLALAIALGLVISKPLLLRIFSGEVKAQVVVDKNAQRAAARAALKQQFAAVPKLQSKAESLESEINTPSAVGTVLDNSPEYHALAERYGRFRQEERQATNAQAAAAYAHAANETLRQMGPLREHLLNEEATDNVSRTTSARQQLKATHEQLAPLQSELKLRNEELRKGYEAPSGLADQDKALNILEHDNSAIGTQAKLLWLFIVAVDMLPALMKLLLVLGRPSPYEETQESFDDTELAETWGSEEERLKRVELRVKAAHEHAENQFRIKSEVGKHRLKQQIAIQREMDEISMRTMQETIRPHVEHWARAVAEEYARRLAEESTPDAFAARERRARGEQGHRGDGANRTYSSRRRRSG
jgi:Domain of unknown function (DUF4407)